MNVVRIEVQVEQLRSDSIINLKEPSKYHKDKSRFRVNKDSVSNTIYRTEYNTGETERYTFL